MKKIKKIWNGWSTTIKIAVVTTIIIAIGMIL